MTARKRTHLALRRRMQRVAAVLEAWSQQDHSYLPPTSAAKMAHLQRGYASAARQIRENL